MSASKPPTPYEAEESPSRAGSIDPTQNVLQLVRAAIERQDDLREQAISNVKELAALRADHAREMAGKEESRLDSIRQVDTNNQAAQAKSALDAIQALAQVTTTNADTIRNALNTTAQQIAKQTTDLAASIATQTANSNDALIQRLAALEKAASEGVGKERVADPAMAAMAASVASLVASQNTGAGRGAGAGTTIAYIFAGIGAVGGLIGIAVAAIALLAP